LKFNTYYYESPGYGTDIFYYPIASFGSEKITSIVIRYIYTENFIDSDVTYNKTQNDFDKMLNTNYASNEGKKYLIEEVFSLKNQYIKFK